MEKYEYKVVVINGANNLPIKKLEKELNKQAQDGWEHDFQVFEVRKRFIFFVSASVVVTLKRKAS